MATKRLLRVTTIILAAALFSVAVAGSVLAAPSTQTERQGFFGEITEVGDGVVTLLLSNGESVPIVIDNETEIRVPPTDDGEEAGSLDESHVGSRVAVATEMRDGDVVATKLTVIPSRTRQIHRTVTVIERIGNIIVAETESGDEVIVELEFEPDEDLKGQVVTFIGRQIEANRISAKRAVGLKAVVDRLDKHVRSRTESAGQERDAAARTAKERQLAELKARLERTITRQLDRFSEVLLKAPEEARAALEQAHDRLSNGLRNALQAIGKKGEELERAVNRRALNGTIETVNVEDGIVTIRTKGDHTASIGAVDETEIRIGDEVSELGDLMVGDRVEVLFDKESGDALGIRVVLIAGAKGRIDAIDTENGTLTLVLPDESSLTLNVADIAAVQINGESQALDSLELGTVVGVRYNTRTLEITAVAAELKAEHVLTIVGVDREAGTVTGRTPDGRIVTLRVAIDVRIEVAGRRAGIAAIKAGVRVHVVVDRTSHRVLVIRAVGGGQRKNERTFRGFLRAIDVEARALSVQRGEGVQIDVILADDAEIVLNDEPVDVDALHADTVLSITYDPETKLALKVVARDRVEPERVIDARAVKPGQAKEAVDLTGEVTVGGTIVRIDPDNDRLAIFTERRRVLDLTITDGTVITLNGEAVDGLEGIERGSQVKALIDADAEEVLELNVHKREVDREQLRKEVDAEDVRDRLQNVRSELTLQVRGVPVVGTDIALIVTAQRKPV